MFPVCAQDVASLIAETTKHMLFICPRTQRIWHKMSLLFKINITWKHIVCGFPKYTATVNIRCINTIISIIAYSIFKINSQCKYEQTN